jgi:cell division septation protein DedD
VIVVLSTACSSAESSPSRTPETVSTPELPAATPTVAALAPSPTPTPFPTVPAITPELPTFALAFEPIGDMDTAREEHSETRLDGGRVLIVGGRNQFGTVLTATFFLIPRVIPCQPEES